MRTASKGGAASTATGAAPPRHRQGELVGGLDRGSRGASGAGPGHRRRVQGGRVARRSGLAHSRRDDRGRGRAARGRRRELARQRRRKRLINARGPTGTPIRRFRRQDESRLPYRVSRSYRRRSTANHDSRMTPTTSAPSALLVVLSFCRRRRYWRTPIYAFSF